RFFFMAGSPTRNSTPPALGSGALNLRELLGSGEVRPCGLEIAVQIDGLPEGLHGAAEIPPARARDAEVVPERRSFRADLESLDQDRFGFRGLPGLDERRAE